MIDSLPSFGRKYVWQSQIVMVSTVALGLRRIKQDATDLGLDIDEFKATLIANLDQQFRDAGIHEFLQASSYARVINRFV